MATSKELRIFDPTKEPILFHNNHESATYKKPEDCLAYNPGWGVTHLNHYDIQSPDTPQPDPKTLVVSIHGKYAQDFTTACIAVFFAQSSTSNFRTLVTCEPENTGEALTLQAAEKAIDLISNHAVVNDKSLKRLVIMTSSYYLFVGITEEVWAWEQTNYFEFPFRYNKQRANWQSLQRKVKELEAIGISVRWWLVESNDISAGGTFLKRLFVNAFLASKPDAPGPNDRPSRKGQSLEKYRAEFFKNWPPRNLATQELFQQIGLDFPEPGQTPDILGVLRRLVISGEDESENFTLLFGTDHDIRLWVVAQWQPIRKSILLMSRTRMLANELCFDEAKYWNFRPRSAEEEEQLIAEASKTTVEEELSDADAPHEDDDEYESFMPPFNVAS